MPSPTIASLEFANPCQFTCGIEPGLHLANAGLFCDRFSRGSGVARQHHHAQAVCTERCHGFCGIRSQRIVRLKDS
jgi:hypothetical protein